MDIMVSFPSHNITVDALKVVSVTLFNEVKRKEEIRPGRRGLIRTILFMGPTKDRTVEITPDVSARIRIRYVDDTYQDAVYHMGDQQEAESDYVTISKKIDAAKMRIINGGS